MAYVPCNTQPPTTNHQPLTANHQPPTANSIYHARRIPDLSGSGDFEEYGYGHYRSPYLGRLAAQLGLKTGVVSTSDSLDANEQDLQILRAEGVSVKEMEAAAVAW